MIFPIIDLVPDICEDLSVRDIRAIACTSRDVHDMIAPFMEERADKTIEQLSISAVTHYKSAWPRMHRVIEHEIVIRGDSFYTDVPRLSHNYTGIITITCMGLSYNPRDKVYICSRDGIALYGISGHKYNNFCQYSNPCVYTTFRSKHFIYFIDDFMVSILCGLLGGYIVESKICELRAHAYARGYKSLHEFIGSKEFMKIIAQW